MRLNKFAYWTTLTLGFLFSACSEPETAKEESSKEEKIEASASKKGTLLELAEQDSSSEILPIPPDLLEAPPMEVSGDLGVLMVGPQGLQEAPRQAVIVFDRPMVALTDLDSMNETVPIECGPDLQGKARWAGTTTAVWIPEDGRFPLSSSLQCSVPKGTASLDGASLEEDLIWHFQDNMRQFYSVGRFAGLWLHVASRHSKNHSERLSTSPYH